MKENNNTLLDLLVANKNYFLNLAIACSIGGLFLSRSTLFITIDLFIIMVSLTVYRFLITISNNTDEKDQ